MSRSVFFALFSLLAVPAAAQQPTFSGDIAPVLWKRCGTCHRPGQSAPFSLLTFEEVRPRAREIAKAVESRTMPPWKPEPGYGEFDGARRLPDAEIALLTNWADRGSARGNPDDLPAMPTWSEGWELGKPDLIVRMPEAYNLKGSGLDVFRTFVIPISVDSTRFVRAIEFRPEAGGAVHHANIKIDRTRASQRLDEEEPGVGYEGGGSRKAEFPDGHFLGWTPGQSARLSPPGMAWRIEPQSDLVIEAHLVPTGKPQAIQLSVGLYFTDQAPVRVPYTLRLGRQDIDIAPNATLSVADSFTLPVDVDVLGVQPHAHYLAREVRAFATEPGGNEIPLILIKDWDFHWQDNYRFAAPIPLRKGSILTMKYSYDNSAANRRNPNKPPKRVTYGQTTASEMASLWVQVVPRSESDRQILDARFGPKLLADDLSGYEKMLSVNADDPRLHTALAQAYAEEGRTAEALQHFEEAVKREPTAYREYDLGATLLRIQRWDDAASHFGAAVRMKPQFAEAHYGLGIAQQQQGKLVEATASYRAALAGDSRFADAYYNLGRALAAQGQLDAAIAEYRHALEITPSDSEAHTSLGSALMAKGQEAEAAAHYRIAVQESPNSIGPLVDLAWILATSEQNGVRNPSLAVAFAARAAALTRYQDPAVLDTLALAYAASGNIAKAIETGESALRLARAAGAAAQAEQIGRRLDIYKQQKP